MHQCWSSPDRSIINTVFKGQRDAVSGAFAGKHSRSPKYRAAATVLRPWGWCVGLLGLVLLGDTTSVLFIFASSSRDEFVDFLDGSCAQTREKVRIRKRRGLRAGALNT